MTCENVDLPGGGRAIICTRGPGRRVCDICEKPASGPKERLRDGRPFDACATCRGRIGAARQRRAEGLATIDRDWILWAAARIDRSLAIA